MKKIWLRNALTIIGIVALVIFVYIGTSVTTSNKSQLDQIATNRILACQADNRVRADLRLTFHNSVEKVIPPGSFPEREQFISLYESEVDRTLPNRLCTQKGIDAWLHGTGGTIPVTTTTSTITSTTTDARLQSAP